MGSHSNQLSYLARATGVIFICSFPHLSTGIPAEVMISGSLGAGISIFSDWEQLFSFLMLIAEPFISAVLVCLQALFFFNPHAEICLSAFIYLLLLFPHPHLRICLLILQREGRRKREREKHWLVAFWTHPDRELTLQTRHVSQPGIKPQQPFGVCIDASAYWATLARAVHWFLEREYGDGGGGETLVASCMYPSGVLNLQFRCVPRWRIKPVSFWCGLTFQPTGPRGQGCFLALFRAPSPSEHLLHMS